MKNNYKIIASNIFSNYAFLFLSIVIALLMSPFIVHTLGDFFYGVWSIVAAITGYFSVLDLGINRAIVRYVSKYDAERNVTKLNVFFNTVFVIFCIVAFFIVVLTLILTIFFDSFIDLKEHVDLSRAVLFVCGMDFALSFPAGVIYAILIAKQKHTAANKINIINSILRNIAIYVSLLYFPNILVLAFCNVIFNVMRNIYVVLEAKKIAPEIMYRPSLFSKDEMGYIFNYSIYSFAVSMSSRVINFTDELVVGFFLKVSDVTYYAIVVNLITYFEKIILAGVSVFVPYISQLESSRDQATIENTFFIGFRFTLLSTLFIYYGILFLGKPFINLWMGEVYGAIAFPILIVLSTAKMISLGQSMTMARLFGTSNHKFFAMINTLEAFSNVFFTIILVNKYQLIGVAIGTLIPCVVFNGIVLPIYTFFVFKINFFDFLKNSIIGPLQVFLLSSLIIYKIELNTDSIVNLIVNIIAISSIYIFITLLTCFDIKIPKRVKYEKN